MHEAPTLAQERSCVGSRGSCSYGGQAPTRKSKPAFQQALDIACRQQANSLELRAAMSLARLWQGQGKHAEARQLLAPIYDWFTEGFDTADLREAKRLLEAFPWSSC
jgi:predicted ATPase